MTGWVKVDTKFTSHPKVLEIGPLGEALWLRGLCYAGDQLTDGFVPTSFLKRMADMKATALAGRLVAAGLWEATEGGYRIHDFLAWQRSRDEVSDISTKRAEAGKKGGQQKASNVLANGKQDASKPLANGRQTAGKLSSKTLAALKDTDTDADTEEISPPSPSLGESPATPKTAKTPIPENLIDLIPADVWHLIADEQRLTDDQLRFETAMMIDHFQGNGEQRPGWMASWRKWMRSPYRQSRPVDRGGVVSLPDGVTPEKLAEIRQRRAKGWSLSEEQAAILAAVDGVPA